MVRSGEMTQLVRYLPWRHEAWCEKSGEPCMSLISSLESRDRRISEALWPRSSMEEESDLQIAEKSQRQVHEWRKGNGHPTSSQKLSEMNACFPVSAVLNNPGPSSWNRAAHIGLGLSTSVNNDDNTPQICHRLIWSGQFFRWGPPLRGF